MPTSDSTATTGAGHQPVLDRIRDSIVRGDFAPNQRLVEPDLAAQFGVSRGSVRTALIELANEGLVERIQHRGARVRAITLEQAIEISEVRMVVEGLCAAKAASRVTDVEVRELRALGDEMHAAVANSDVLHQSNLNSLLHQRVREIGGQATASDMLERLRAQNVRHVFRLTLQAGRPSVSLTEHLAIIDEICAHAPEGAERAMRRHLLSVIEALRASP